MKQDKEKIGCVVMDIVPGENNPRNSEGAFMCYEDGEVVFIYSHFKGNDPNDNAPSDLYICRSMDDGKSFGPGSLLFACEEEPATNLMSVSLLPMKNGDMGLFYLNKEKGTARVDGTCVRAYMRRSPDRGHTWSDPILCMERQGSYVINNDRIVRLSDGKLLLPAAFHRSGFCGNPNTESRGYFEGWGEVVFYMSEDDGDTWEQAPGRCVLPYSAHNHYGLQEPGVLELYPGCVWMWARTGLGRQYEAFSHDGGRSWGAVQPSWFTGPCSPLSMKRMPDGRLLAVWNPYPICNGMQERGGPGWNGNRTPLVMAFSTDNGESFSDPYVIEDEADHGYCYCAIGFTKDAILLAYCAGGPKDGSILSKTRIRRIPLTVPEGC